METAVPATRARAWLFNSDRQGKRVTRRCLTEIADPFQYGLKNRTEKWGVPLLMLPRAMTTRAGETSSWSNISRMPNPTRWWRSCRPGSQHASWWRWGTRSGVPAALGESISLLPERSARGPDVCAHVSLFPIFRASLPQPAPLAGDAHAGTGNRFSAVYQRLAEG